MNYLIVLVICILISMSGCRPDGELKKSLSSQPLLSYQFIEPSTLSGTNAITEVESFISIHPRVSGSAESKLAVEHVSQKLKEIGWEPFIDEFTNDTPSGPVVFRNVSVITEKAEKIILLASHTDTKKGLPDSFKGANDSGSSTGLLIELARVIKKHKYPAEWGFVFAFLDGEECIENYSANDGLHGSKRLIAMLKEKNMLHLVKYAIILDMIGDKDLTITIPQNVDTMLVSLAFDAAEEENIRKHFALYGQYIIDDHEPFMQAGIPSLLLIDFLYGSKKNANDYWHTTEDTIDKLSADSLEKVGRVVIRIINKLMSDSLKTKK